MLKSLFARKRQFVVTTFLLGMFCCNLTFLRWCAPYLPNGHQDFIIYYMSGRLLRQGQAAALYNPDVQYRSQLEFTHVPNRKRAIPFNHPPFEALLFVPLAMLDFFPAYLLWDVMNLMMLGASAMLLRQLPGIREMPPRLLALSCAAFPPIAIGMIQGQDIFLLLLLMVLALLAMNRGDDVVSGAWLAAGLFRPHMILPLLVLLAFRRWRILLGFLPVAVALAGISAMIAGWRWPLAYLHFVLQVERERGSSFGPHQVPNLRGLIADLPGLHESSLLVVLLITAASLAVYGLALRRIRDRRDSPNYYFCLAITATILVSFHALWYDFTLLLPVVLFLVVSFMREEVREVPAILLLLLVFLFLAPLYIDLELNGHIFWLGLIPLVLFLRLLRAPAPAAEPA